MLAIPTNLTLQVGMNGSLFGVDAAVKEQSKDAYRNDRLRAEPPGAMPCADVSK